MSQCRRKITVVLTRGAQEQFDRLPRVVQARMLRVFRRLLGWPGVSGLKCLRGALAGHYRMRTGDYRVHIRLEEGSVVIEKVGHRDGFYDE